MVATGVPYRISRAVKVSCSFHLCITNLSPSLWYAPIATRVPSSDIETDHPKLSLIAPPLMLEPTCVQTLPVYWYTLTRPDWYLPEPLLPGAPAATIQEGETVPRASPTDHPNLSPTVSPTISEPILL